MQLCLVLAFLLACYASCNGDVSDVQEEEGSRLTGRMDRLESLLVVQANKMAAYDSQLEDLKRQLLSRDRQLAFMADKIATMERSGAEKNEDMKELKRGLRERDSKILKLEQQMAEQKQELELFSRQEEHSRYQLQQQFIQMSTLKRQFQELSGLADQAPEHTVDQSSDDVDRIPQKRSDDGGPLEVVVSQLSQQVTQMSADVQSLKNNDLQQAQGIQNAQTSTFVRWGSSQCPSTSDLVYSGVIGSSFYGDSGSGANYLCLTMSPVFGSDKTYGAYLYGTEYETGDSYQDKDAVCTVCRSSFTTTIMIPGTNVCTQGWHTQYTGYLMSSHVRSGKSEWICVDSAFESSVHGDADQVGAQLFYTRTSCGSLPCGPYAHVKTVLCAVCSK